MRRAIVLFVSLSACAVAEDEEAAPPGGDPAPADADGDRAPADDADAAAPPPGAEAAEGALPDDEAPPPPAAEADAPLPDEEDAKRGACAYSRYNCRLQSGSGGGHRVRNPATGTNEWPLAGGTALLDGAGRRRGTVADRAVLVNYGQRKRIAGAAHVYVWNATLAEGGRASGWIREGALRDGPVRMPTLALPDPGQGDYPTARLVTGGDPAAYGDLTHTAGHEGDGSKAAHYLLRAGGVVNLFYNVGQMGGISTDTYPTGVVFRRARGVGQIEIPLYRPGSHTVARRMPFVYGHIDGRYGWMAVDAMRLIEDAAPPPPPPPPPAHACFARCCDGTLAGPFDTPDANACHAASGPACDAHGHVRRAEWDGQTAFERQRACWAKCREREAYHRLDGVTEDCAGHARDFCSVGSRGGLQDAAWDACRP